MRRSRSTLLLALGAPLMFTACATIGPPQPPSLELPKPPTDLRAVRKGDRVTLTWTRSERYDRSADGAKRGSDADLPGTRTRVDAVRNSGR